MSRPDAAIILGDPRVLLDGQPMRHATIDFGGVPVHASPHVPPGKAFVLNSGEVQASLTFKIDDADVYRQFTDMQAQFRAEFRQHFTLERRVDVADPSKRRVRSLRGLWRQIRDIFAYEYAKARDGRPPQRVTRLDNMLITGITS